MKILVVSGASYIGLHMVKWLSPSKVSGRNFPVSIEKR
jgi:UDP-glucose 4-epimerase